jgi:two-component system NtrC family response regulator
MILIIDDDPAVRSSMSLLLKQAGYEPRTATHPDEARMIIRQTRPDLVILDLNFSNDTSGKEGLAFLPELTRDPPGIPVILVTAWASISLAVEGMKLGAFDFISKPWQNDAFLKTINTAVTINSLSSPEMELKRSELDSKFDFSMIVGSDRKFLPVLETVGRISGTDVQVLILGESGTGKELIAESIHSNSRRSNGPFIKVNLGAVPHTLFESEMFGHRKGAFTDAYNDRKGSFERADGGTIFLDEIGDLDLKSQVKLLRVLQDQTYQVLGDSRIRKVNVRVICATNRDLKRMVKEGTFREDLFYRINLITLNIPPLRERRKDIPLLAEYFLEEMGKSYDTDRPVLTREAHEWLKNLPFYGNVRELRNLVERTWLMSGKTVMVIHDLETALKQVSLQQSKGELPPPGSMTLEDIEKEMIIRSIKEYRNNLSKVAKSLGISRGTLYRRLEKFGIPVHDKS